MSIRPLCQYDYPDTLTKAGKPANASCCVLTCVQMLIESITGEAYIQTDFYSRMLRAGIIRDDGYINNYDNALVMILTERHEFIHQPQVRQAIIHNMRRWQFFRPDVDAIPLPAIGYLASRQHAVLIIGKDKDIKGDVELVIIDPKFRGEKAKYNIPAKDIKKVGTYV